MCIFYSLLSSDRKSSSVREFKVLSTSPVHLNTDVYEVDVMLTSLYLSSHGTQNIGRPVTCGTRFCDFLYNKDFP